MFELRFFSQDEAGEGCTLGCGTGCVEGCKEGNSATEKGQTCAGGCATSCAAGCTEHCAAGGQVIAEVIESFTDWIHSIFGG